ncbi:MAG: hypothetical protein RLZZ28_1929 [Bacteroidota bacterium]
MKKFLQKLIAKFNSIQKLVLAFGLVFVLLVINIFSYLDTNLKIREADEMVNHTNEILLVTENLKSSVFDMEIGSKGYLVSGDTMDLKFYQMAKRDFIFHYNTLVSIEKRQQHGTNEANTIKSMIERWIKQVDTINSTIPANTSLSLQQLTKISSADNELNAIKRYIDNVQLQSLNLQQVEKNKNAHIIEENKGQLFLLIFFEFIILSITLIVLVNNIVHKKKKNEEIAKANRFLRFNAFINDLILNENNLEKLFEGFTSISVSAGGFRFAFVAKPDDTTRLLKVICWDGFENGYLNLVKNISSDFRPEGQGPTGKAIREKHYQYCNDIATDPIMLPWREQALRNNYRSSITLPVIVENKVFVVLSLYTDKANFFNPQELDMLQKIAANYSFAITNILINERRLLAESNLHTITKAIEQSSSSVIITNINGEIEYVNPYFLALTGYALEEVIGHDPSILIAGDPASEEYQAIWNQLLSGIPWSGELLNRKKNGEPYWENAVVSPVVDENKKIIHFVAVKENITVKKQLTEAITENNLVIAHILKATIDIISVEDKTGKRILISESAEKIFGYSKEEMRSIPGFFWLHENTAGPDIDRSFIEARLKSGQSLNQYETNNFSKKGQHLVISWTTIWDKETSCYYSIGRDITLKREITRLREKEKEITELKIRKAVFEGEERQKRVFSLELHDNINQILAAIQMYFDMYLLNRKEEILISVKEMISNAIQEIRNLSHNIAPLPDLGIGWIPTIRQLLQRFGNNEKTLFHFEADKEVYVLDNDLKLSIYRIIQEQINNIHKYAKARNAYISLSEKDAILKLVIQDDGIGANPDQLNNGIGLTNIQTRSSMFRGHMHIETNPNKGFKLQIEFIL